MVTIIELVIIEGLEVEDLEGKQMKPYAGD